MPSLFSVGLGSLVGLDGSTVAVDGGGVGLGAGIIGQYQLGAFTNPRNGQRPIDANQVRLNDVTLLTALNAHDSDSTIHLQSSALSSRPAPGVTGRKWLTHDSGIALGWFDSGTAWVPLTVSWEHILNRPSSFAPAAHTHVPGAVVGLEAALAERPITGSAATFSSVTAPTLTASTLLELPTRAIKVGASTLTFPSGAGTTGQVLTTDGAGALSWVTPAGGGGGGSVDWTAITGRPSTFAPSAHTHAPGEISSGQFPIGVVLLASQLGNGAIPNGVTMAWGQLTGVPATFPPAAHTQAWSTITGVPATLPSDWSTLANKPATFPPATHRHGWADLDNVPGSFPPAAHTHPYSSLSGIPSTFAPSPHAHATSDITGLDAALTAKASLAGANFSALTLQGLSVAAVIVSSTTPVGGAPENTIWVQV